MRVIDPFQFRDMFRPAHSIAIVGNAPSVLDWKNGSVIDSHDMIVRFNRSRTEGLEEHVGSRTDVLFVNVANTKAKAPPPAETLRPRCLVGLVTPQGIRDFDIGPFQEWAGDCDVLLSFAPEGLPAIARPRRFTNGTCALYTLLKVFDVKKLFVTGFTMYGAVPGGNARYWKEATPQPEEWHDLDEEAQVFTAILGKFTGELVVTAEIEALAKKNAVTLSSNGSTGTPPIRRRLSLRKWLAEGLAWRVLHAGMSLRRIAESE